MRRLWSHIIIAATSLMMVGATFATVVTNIDSNIEFTSGRELVFRVAEKGDDGNPDETITFDNDKAVKEIAGIMEERMKTADISRYKVETQGYDTIKVSFVQDTDQQYEIIKNYLSFNASLAISNSKGTYALATEFLNSKKEAYMETTDGYPAIIIPIDKDNEMFQAVYTEAKEMNDNNEGEVEQESEDEDDGEEHEHVHKAYLYLWYNYVEDYYSYDKINQNDSDNYDPTIANKVLMTFDVANPFLDEDEDELRAYVNPSNGDTEVTAEALKTAYENARYYVNLLNAGEMNYHVSFLFSEKADMWVEDLISLENHETVAWSRTFIATLCAMVVVSLLLVYFYRLGALSVATTSIVSTFMGLLFIVLFSAEFNIAGIVGLVSLALTSVISGIIYLSKLKDECYRGRSLKKANAEAAKKALLPTIDVHVVLVAAGVASYLLGGVIMKGFALCAILGGLVSLVLNLAGLRGLLWLATNEQGIANRYDLFDVSKDQVPNALEEEKQKYFGANADRDFTKSKKPVGIIAAILLVASVGGLIFFGVKNNGAVYGTTSQFGNSQIYVEYRSNIADNTALSTDTKERLNEMLDHAYLDGQKLADVTEIDSYDYTSQYKATKSGIDTVYYAYYRISFNKALTGEEVISYKDDAGNELFTEPAATFFTMDTLNSTSGANLSFDHNVDISLKNSVRVNADQPEFKSLILASTVLAGISFAYLLLRYRLSRGIAVLGIATLTVGISAGIFALLFFLPVTSYVSVALPFIALFTFDIAVLFMNKEREMVLEDRSRDNSVEARENLMKRALGISSTPITISFIIALYLGVNFFGFMFTSVSWVFLLMILGVCIATGLVLVVFGPFAHMLYKAFSKVKIAKPAKANKKKKAPVRVKKSAEPEEAIFIGIND